MSGQKTPTRYEQVCNGLMYMNKCVIVQCLQSIKVCWNVVLGVGSISIDKITYLSKEKIGLS